jgi:hypothetical protein
MEITWKIYDMYRESKNGFVTQIYGGCEASEIDVYKNMFSFEYTQESEDFIPYEDLTEEIVLSWVFEALDKESYEAQTTVLYNELIEELTNPSIIEGKPF